MSTRHRLKQLTRSMRPNWKKMCDINRPRQEIIYSHDSCNIILFLRYPNARTICLPSVVLIIYSIRHAADKKLLRSSKIWILRRQDGGLTIGHRSAVHAAILDIYYCGIMHAADCMRSRLRFGIRDGLFSSVTEGANGSKMVVIHHVTRDSLLGNLQLPILHIIARCNPQIQGYLTLAVCIAFLL